MTAPPRGDPRAGSGSGTSPGTEAPLPPSGPLPGPDSSAVAGAPIARASPPPRGASSHRAPGDVRGWLSAAAPALVLATAVVACYANSLRVPFQFDDPVMILGEPAITGFHPSPWSRRFLGDLSFAISYRLSGDRPLGYHAANVAIHLANALLVLWLVGALLRAAARRSTAPVPVPVPAAAAPGARAGAGAADAARAPRTPTATDIAALAPGRDRAVAFLAALLFAVHPLQTQAVTYVVQRYASLAALFFLLACGAYVRFRLAATRRAAAGWYAGFLLSALAAFWTKENAFVLPLAVLLVELTCFSASPARRLLYLAPFAAGAAVAALVLLGTGTSLAALDAATRVDTAMPRLDYALTQLRVVAQYLGLLVLPVGQNLDHDVAVSRSFLDPAVRGAAALHAALVAGGILAIVRGRRRGAPLWTVAGVGVLWFYATLLVESSFIPIVDVMYEHRVYLPSAGAFATVACLLGLVPAFAPRRAWVAVTIALALPLAGLTVARNRVWRSELSLWTDSASKSPHKPRPLNGVGTALFDRGDVRGALAWYRRALEADPGYVKAWFNAAEAMQRLGDCPEAIPLYERFLAVAPEYPDTYENLAACWERLGRPELATQYRAAGAAEARRRGGAPLPPTWR